MIAKLIIAIVFILGSLFGASMTTKDNCLTSTDAPGLYICYVEQE